MIVGVLILFVVVALIAISFALSAQSIPTDRRGLVFKFGQFTRILAPGFHILLPLFEKVKVVELQAEIPGWQTLSEDQIQAGLRARYVPSTRG